MPGLFEHLHVLERLIDRYIPAVAHVLSRANLSVVLILHRMDTDAILLCV